MMSAFLGPKDGLESRLLDEFVIKRKLSEPPRPKRDREPAPRADREDLIEALEELGTALRKERTLSQELRTRIERLASSHQKQSAELQTQIQTADARERELREKQNAFEKKEKELEEKFSAAQTERAELKAQLSRLEQDRAEELRKARFELDLFKAGQQHQSAASEQLRRALGETRLHYDRMRLHAQSVGQALRQSEEGRKALESKLAEARRIMQQMHASLTEARQLSAKTAQERDLTSHQLQSLKERSMEQNRRWTTERTRVQDLESSIESERNEKHMVLACLRAAEAKLGQRDEQIAYLTKELEALRTWNTSRAAQAHAATYIAPAAPTTSKPQPEPPAAPILSEKLSAPEPGPLSGALAAPLSPEDAKKLYENFFVAYPQD